MRTSKAWSLQFGGYNLHAPPVRLNLHAERAEGKWQCVPSSLKWRERKCVSQSATTLQATGKHRQKGPVDPPLSNCAQIHARCYVWFPQRSAAKKQPSRSLRSAAASSAAGGAVPDRWFTPATASVDRLECPRIRRQRWPVVAARKTAFLSRSVIPGHASTNASNSGNRLNKSTTFPLSSVVDCSAFAAREPGPLNRTPVFPTFSPVSCPGFCSLSAHFPKWNHYVPRRMAANLAAFFVY